MDNQIKKPEKLATNYFEVEIVSINQQSYKELVKKIVENKLEINLSHICNN